MFARRISKLKMYENSFHSQRSRSNVTNFQPPLAFTMAHISTKLHQFLSSSFWDFVQTVTDTHAQTHKQTDTAQNNTCSQHARAGNKVSRNIVGYHTCINNCNVIMKWNYQLTHSTNFLACLRAIILTPWHGHPVTNRHRSAYKKLKTSVSTDFQHSFTTGKGIKSPIKIIFSEKLFKNDEVVALSRKICPRFWTHHEGPHIG